MIYVPDLDNYKCIVVQNADTIRAYTSVPTINSDIPYRDFYVNSHYLYKNGTQTFGNYGYNNLPTCMSADELTSSIYYRNDFDNILTIFFIIIVFVYFCFKKIARGFFFGLRWS